MGGIKNKGKVLHLVVSKRWFDMIASGEKKTEYREIKQYWINRLCHHAYRDDLVFYSKFPPEPKCKWDYIVFKNGYQKDARTVKVEFLRLGVEKPRPEWSDGMTGYWFALHLGEIVTE